ncbi:DUF433 domain-containing protein [Castellaniella hirudinis]|uniref:DUF433 domain-containing protein n=1 Tax=Castellaniella hirudinis TaxID=1144617 RepID=A0ABV8RUW4_9BURK
MELIGLGLYTPNQAARITGADPREVRRWMFGYKNQSGELQPPLWQPQITQSEDKVIGFMDLMELRIVKAFVRHGVPLRTIRASIQSAQQIFDTPYPFTANRFLTDGKSIFYEAIHQEPQLTDLLKKQLVFESIIRPSLYAGIEFDATGTATRWYPLKKSRAVILDPKLSFGRPSLSKFGIPTEIIAAAVKVEGNQKRVASQFDIPVADVSAAVKFEDQLMAA